MTENDGVRKGLLFAKAAGWIVLKVSSVAFAAVVFGFVIPYQAAKRSGVYSESQILRKIQASARESTKDWFTAISQYEAATDALAAAQQEVSRRMAAAGAPAAGQPAAKADELKALVETHAELEKQLSTRAEVIDAFGGSPMTTLWVWTFLTIGTMWLVLKPGTVPGSDPRENADPAAGRVTILWRTALTGAAIYGFYEWPSILRSFFPPSSISYPPQTLFYDTRWVSTLSLAVAQGLNLVYSLLLAAIWWQWITFYRDLKAKSEADKRSAEGVDNGSRFVALATDPKNSRLLAATLLHWLVMSMLLASSYMFDTLFYWNVVVSRGDGGYALSAVLEHTVWAISWVILSLPLAHLASNWRDLRARALQGVSGEARAERGRVIDQSKPFGLWLAVVANGAAVVTFLASLVHAVGT